MPKQNRSFVRDTRLQAKKKRTDRSYLRSAAAPVPPQQPPGELVAADNGAAPGAAEPSSPRGAAAASVGGSARPPTAVRAIQQQGVRKRREFDTRALLVRDSRYAMHELRRIFSLAALVVVTLIVLGIVLR